MFITKTPDIWLKVQFYFQNHDYRVLLIVPGTRFRIHTIVHKLALMLCSSSGNSSGLPCKVSRNVCKEYKHIELFGLCRDFTSLHDGASCSVPSARHVVSIPGGREKPVLQV